MSKAVKNQLWRLISTLDKSEKRNFKIYATRTGGKNKKDSKFIQLFDVLEKLDQPNDQIVMQRLDLTTGQYSNLKRHLYHELLTSLRLIYISKEVDIELREQIDFAQILYGKGHYLDALRILERAATYAYAHDRDLLHLEILEFQKLIEARHVTLSRQVKNKMDELVNHSARRATNVFHTSELVSINIQIQGRYIELGHIRSPEELAAAQEFWGDVHRAQGVWRDEVPASFHQKVHRAQSNMWYRYLQLRFEEALEAARAASGLFGYKEDMRIKDPDLYLRCQYYVNVFGYLTGNLKTVEKHAALLENFLDNEAIQLNENSRRIGSIYRYLARYNACFLSGDAPRAYALAKTIGALWQAGEFRPNEHRWGLFLYKAAAACFLLRHFDEALDHLNDVINMKGNHLREDLLINTRILHALCNFELGHFSLVDYHLTNISRLLRRSQEAAEVHKLAVSGLRRLLKAPSAERSTILQQLAIELVPLAAKPFEQKALRYLDLRAWLQLHATEKRNA